MGRVVSTGQVHLDVEGAARFSRPVYLGVD
jgi:hypothetical protein